MNLLSININKNYLYYALLSNTSGTISLLQSNSISIPQNQDPTALMDHVQTMINNLLCQNKNLNKIVFIIPSSMANINKDMMIYNIMPVGVATLSCFRRNLACDYKSTSNIAPVRLGYSRDTKSKQILKDMDTKFPSMAYKNDDMRKTILLGYGALV